MNTELLEDLAFAAYHMMDEESLDIKKVRNEVLVEMAYTAQVAFSTGDQREEHYIVLREAKRRNLSLRAL